MIYEYAFHPDFLMEILDKNDLLRSLYRSVGVGKPCIMSDYPDVCSLFYQKAQEQINNARDPKLKTRWEERRNKIAEIKSQLFAKTIVRCNAVPWGDSFINEHTRHPFQGILTINDKKQTNVCQDIAWLQQTDSSFFKHTHGTRALRSAQHLANTLKPLLQNSKKITIVDPYFSNIENDNVYNLYVTSICASAHVRSTTKLKVIVACKWPCDDKNLRLTKVDFENRCAHIFRNVDVNKVNIEIYAIKAHNSGQEFHNRYILTDIGGVIFGHGTGASPRNFNQSFDQLSLLPAADLAYWLNVYKPHSSYFNWSEPPIHIS